MQNYQPVQLALPQNTKTLYLTSPFRQPSPMEMWRHQPQSPHLKWKTSTAWHRRPSSHGCWGLLASTAGWMPPQVKNHQWSGAVKFPITMGKICHDMSWPHSLDWPPLSSDRVHYLGKSHRSEDHGSQNGPAEKVEDHWQNDIYSSFMIVNGYISNTNIHGLDTGKTWTEQSTRHLAHLAFTHIKNPPSNSETAPSPASSRSLTVTIILILVVLAGRLLLDDLQLEGWTFAQHQTPICLKSPFWSILGWFTQIDIHHRYPWNIHRISRMIPPDFLEPML